MALNLYNGVVIVDPLGPEGGPVAKALLNAWKENFPIRMGLLPQARGLNFDV